MYQFGALVPCVHAVPLFPAQAAHRQCLDTQDSFQSVVCAALRTYDAHEQSESGAHLAAHTHAQHPAGIATSATQTHADPTQPS